MALDRLETLSKDRYRGPHADENERWHNELKIDLEWAERTNTPLAILIVDLNNLKSINDTISHDAGDRALARIIDLLEELETGGLRIGGDEFGITLRGDEEGAEKLEQSLRTAYSEFLELPENNDLKEAGAGLAVGVGVHRSGAGVSMTELLTEADDRMYEDKERQSEATEEDKEFIRQFINEAVSKGIKRRHIARLVLAELRSGRTISEIAASGEEQTQTTA